MTIHRLPSILALVLIAAGPLRAQDPAPSPGPPAAPPPASSVAVPSLPAVSRPEYRLGPGNVLAGLIKRIDRTVKTISVNNVADLQKAEETVSAA